MPKFNVRITVTHEYEREVELPTKAEAEAWAEDQGSNVDLQEDPGWSFKDGTFDVAWVDQI